MPIDKILGEAVFALLFAVLCKLLALVVEQDDESDDNEDNEQEEPDEDEDEDDDEEQFWLLLLLLIKLPLILSDDNVDADDVAAFLTAPFSNVPVLYCPCSPFC